MWKISFWLDEVNQETATMKVLLQHKETGLYLKERGATTDNRTEAMDFLSSTQAIEFCAAHKINGMQIVLRFDEQHFDIVLPMGVNPKRHPDLGSAHAA